MSIESNDSGGQPPQLPISDVQVVVNLEDGVHVLMNYPSDVSYVDPPVVFGISQRNKIQNVGLAVLTSVNSLKTLPSRGKWGRWQPRSIKLKASL